MHTPELTMDELDRQDRFIAEAVERDEPKLRSFIRSRVLDTGDAEDVLQDVFYELIQAYRMLKPAEQVTAWLYRVARNRITDLFRRRKAVSLSEAVSADEDAPTIEDLLPSPDAGPDALYARNVLMEALDDAIDELPEEQREVFLAHEFDGRSFKELAEETSTSINTLLSRKRYAVLHLRERLAEFSKGLENEMRNDMRKFTVWKVLKILLMVTVGVLLFGYVTMGLWNALIPAIFGLKAITFWQALGLLLLGKILFGGFHRHGGGGPRGWKRHMAERWANMTPEEQEKFRSGMRGRGRCGFGRRDEPDAPSAAV